MSNIKATFRNGRIEPDEPLDLPEGTRLLIPVPETGEEERMSCEEIDRILVAMDKIIPFTWTLEEETELEKDRLARKESEKGHFLDHADKLGKMWK